MNTKQTSENTKHTNVRIDSDVYKKIEMLAAKNERTISNQIRYMLKRYLEITSEQ